MAVQETKRSKWAQRARRRRMTRNLLVLALVCAVLVGTALFVRSRQLVIEFAEDPVVKVNEQADNYQFVTTLQNGQLLTQRAQLDTGRVGAQTMVFTVKPTFGKAQDFNYTVQVVDLESPKISCPDHLEITAGDELDLLEGVRVTDNSNEDISVTVEGDYDLTTPGEYSLTYVASDSSGNRTEEPFTLTVKEPLTFVDEDGNFHFTTSKGFKGIVKDGVTYIDGYLIANKTYSLPKDYGSGLTSETLSAFYVMAAAAKDDGLNIYISSGFRSYNTQANIYRNYVARDGVEKADTYSARAGHSEHQSGLAFDVNIISDAFIGTPEAIWLADNCYKYGFILRYPQGKINETGYKFEPWHFRYVGTELAEILYDGGNWITMEDYFGFTSEYQE